MLLKSPSEIYKAHERFLKKGNYKKAYKCLAHLHNQYPKEAGCIEQIIDFCLIEWERPDIAKRWLEKLIKRRTFLGEYLALSQIEAELGHADQAKKYLKIARELSKNQKQTLPNFTHRQTLSELKKVDEFIKYKIFQFEEEALEEKVRLREERMLDEQRRKDQPPAAKTSKKTSSLAQGKKQEPHLTPPAPQEPKQKPIPDYPVPIKISPLSEKTVQSFHNGSLLTLKESLLLLDFNHLKIQGGFEELLCLNSITTIEKYWYQIETVKKVFKHFHGRVLLCDEVGLGKTIEAGMLIKEYLMRNMAKNVLILTPPALVSQWKEEMLVKFDLNFTTTNDAAFSQDPHSFWQSKLVLASIHTAKNEKNLSLVSKQFYDIVVVDEAHHLRNRTTQTWKAVNLIQKKFIFLLTATPVQNNLIELFNLITLLKPGQFKTERIFKKEFLTKGDNRRPANKDNLRELLKDVMIRNTRSAIDLKLPKRFATTLRLEPTEAEKRVYNLLNLYIRDHAIKRTTANLLLREAGSSPFALKKSLLKISSSGNTKEIIEMIDSLEDISKGHALMELLGKNSKDKKIIFTQYLKSMDYITGLLEKYHYPFVTFNGNMTISEKDASINQFRDDVNVLVSTESGGEGRNIQFCNTIINFDLPWNPMRIEQRIGRLHRIGQTRDVFIFNLSVKGTLEDYIIDILDNKINMFELVIGEIEPIIGQIGKDQEFEEIITEIWMNCRDEKSAQEQFEQFGNELVNAKKEYLKTKALDEEIFGEEYEM